MLRAAVDLIRERALASGDEALAASLAHIRLTQVADRATKLLRPEIGDQTAKAVTTGAIYQQWPTQADFQVDLLFHIAEMQATLVPSLAESILDFQVSRRSAVPLEEVLRRSMEAAHRHHREDPIFRVELSFLLGACNLRLREALMHGRESFYDTADKAWQALLDAYDRRMRHPFSIRDLTRVVSAQVTGSVIVWYTDPGILRDPLGEGGSSLMAHAVVAIFDRLTEVITADGPTEAPDA